MKSRSKISA